MKAAHKNFSQEIRDIEKIIALGARASQIEKPRDFEAYINSNGQVKQKRIDLSQGITPEMEQFFVD